MNMPVIVEVWSVDSLAECLDGVGPALTRKLWSFVPAEESHQREGRVAPAD